MPDTLVRIELLYTQPRVWRPQVVDLDEIERRLKPIQARFRRGARPSDRPL